MKILITNNRLDQRGGAESFVRDLARGLQAQGHTILAYSSNLGQLERLLQTDEIPITTDIENLAFKPDIIHAQHHLDAMTAISALPGIPAIYHCHGAVWRETAPKHPRIYKYLAMSRTLSERLMIESNIAPDDIEVVLNSVELARFRNVRTPSAKPLRALFYNSFHRPESETYLAVQEATRRCGIELEAIGSFFHNMVKNPEEVMQTFDIVFASGRSAIEAMASGCAVVVLGRTSCGELICSENFDRLRQVNFSIAMNSPRPLVDKIESELRRFTAEDAALVTAKVRKEADSLTMVHRLVGIYEDAIEKHHHSTISLEAELKPLRDISANLFL